MEENENEKQKLTLCNEDFIDESGDDMGVFQVVIIVRSEDIGRNDGGPHVSILLIISPKIGQFLTRI